MRRNTWILGLTVLALVLTASPILAQDDEQTPEMKAIEAAVAAGVKAGMEAQEEAEDEKECKEPRFVFRSLTEDSYYGASFRADPPARYMVCFFLAQEQGKLLNKNDDQALPRSSNYARRSEEHADSLDAFCKGLIADNGAVEDSLIGSAYVRAAKDSGDEIPIDLDRKQFNLLLQHAGWIEVYYQAFDEDCEDFTDGWMIVPLHERHTLQAGLGAAYRQEEEGGFESQFDLSLRVRSRWRARWSTSFDFRVLGLGEGSDDDDSMMMAETEPMTEARMEMMPEAEMASTEMKDFNPFEQDGTFVQGDFALAWHPKERGAFAILLGAGVKTLPGDTGNGPDARGRAFLGFRIDSAGLNNRLSAANFGRAKHSLTVAVAHDRAWELPEPEVAEGEETPFVDEDLDRLWIDGQLTLFESDQQTFRLAPRFTIDMPLDGRGSSDIRVSLVAAIQLENLLNFGSLKN